MSPAPLAEKAAEAPASRWNDGSLIGGDGVVLCTAAAGSVRLAGRLVAALGSPLPATALAATALWCAGTLGRRFGSWACGLDGRTFLRGDRCFFPAPPRRPGSSLEVARLRIATRMRVTGRSNSSEADLKASSFSLSGNRIGLVGRAGFGFGKTSLRVFSRSGKMSLMAFSMNARRVWPVWPSFFRRRIAARNGSGMASTLKICDEVFPGPTGRRGLLMRGTLGLMGD